MVEKNLVDKIFIIGNLLQQDNIILNLFALVKKEDSADNWDLVISSKSFSKEEKEIIQDITLLLQKNLTNNELEKIARIVLLKPENQFVKNINSNMAVNSSIINIENSVFNNLLIKQMVLFSSVK